MMLLSLASEEKKESDSFGIALWHEQAFSYELSLNAIALFLRCDI